MGNRTFKAKVVELVVTRLADRLMSPELIGKILLIDWRGSNAQQWTFGEDGPTMIEVLFDKSNVCFGITNFYILLPN